MWTRYVNIRIFNKCHNNSIFFASVIYRRAVPLSTANSSPEQVYKMAESGISIKRLKRKKKCVFVFTGVHPGAKTIFSPALERKNFGASFFSSKANEVELKKSSAPACVIILLQSHPKKRGVSLHYNRCIMWRQRGGQRSLCLWFKPLATQVALSIYFKYKG